MRANPGSASIVSTTIALPGEASRNRGIAANVGVPGMFRSSTTDLRLMSFGERQGRLDISCLSHHGEVRLPVQDTPKPAADQRVIVGEHDPDRIGNHLIASSVGHVADATGEECAG